MGSLKAYRRDRFDTFTRDNFRCVYCGKSAIDDEVYLEIDHLVPLFTTKPKGKRIIQNKGFDWRIDYVTSCRGCNGRKGRKTLSKTQIVGVRKTIRRNLNRMGILRERKRLTRCHATVNGAIFLIDIASNFATDLRTGMHYLYETTYEVFVDSVDSCVEPPDALYEQLQKLNRINETIANLNSLRISRNRNMLEKARTRATQLIRSANVDLRRIGTYMPSLRNSFH